MSTTTSVPDPTVPRPVLGGLSMVSVPARLLAFATVLIGVIIVRLPTISFSYLNVDESVYMLIGAAMNKGGMAYVDLVDRKPVGLFLIYAFADLVFSRPIIGVRIIGALCTVASSWMLMYIARRFLRLALPTAVLAALFFSTYVILFGGDAGQSPVFYMPLVVGAVILIFATLEKLAAAQTPSAMHLAVAGLLLGIALQIKYTPAFESIGFGILLIVIGWRQRHLLSDAGRTALILGLSLMVIGGLLPTVVAGEVFASLGHFKEWLFYNFTVNLDRTATDYPPSLLAMRLAQFAAASAPFLILTARYFWLVRKANTLPQETAAATADDHLHVPGWVHAGLITWWVWTVAAAIIQRQPYSHYLYGMVAPMALYAAAALQRPNRAALSVRAVALGAFLMALAVLGYAGGWRYETAQNGSPYLPKKIAKLLKTEKIQSLYVFNYFGIVYYLSDLPVPTRYPLPSHLLRDLEAASFQFDARAEISRILDEQPEVVIVAKPTDAVAAPDRVKLLDDALTQSYCTWRIYEAGQKKVYLYRHDGGAAGGMQAMCAG